MRLGNDKGQGLRLPGSALVVGASSEAMHEQPNVWRCTRQAAQQQLGSTACRRCHLEARLLHGSKAALHPAKMWCASHQVGRLTLSGTRARQQVSRSKATKPRKAVTGWSTPV